MSESIFKAKFNNAVDNEFLRPMVSLQSKNLVIPERLTEYEFEVADLCYRVCNELGAQKHLLHIYHSSTAVLRSLLMGPGKYRAVEKALGDKKLK